MTMTSDQFLKQYGEGVHQVPLDDDDIDLIIRSLSPCMLLYGDGRDQYVAAVDELIERLREVKGE